MRNDEATFTLPGEVVCCLPKRARPTYVMMLLTGEADEDILYIRPDGLVCFWRKDAPRPVVSGALIRKLQEESE